MGQVMRWLAVGCIVVSLLVPGCAERSFETIPSADWKPGYTYGYGITAAGDYVGTMTVDGDVVEHEESHDDGGEGALMAYRVVNTEMKDGGMPLYLVAITASSVEMYAGSSGSRSSVSEPESGLLAIRQQDLQPVRTIYTSSRDCATCPAKSSTIRFEADGDDYSWIRFPLKYGDSWRGTLPTGSLLGKLGGDYDVESQVGGMVTAEGPQGKIDAVRITHTFTDPKVEAMRQEALADAREEGVTVNALEISNEMSAEVYFAPALHNTVLETREGAVSIYADFVEDGKHFVFDFQASVRLTVRLVSADLTEGPQLSLPEAIASLEEPVVVPEPQVAPKEQDSPGGSLKVVGTHTLVNAADAPTVHFDIQESGSAQATSHKVLDAEGMTVASGAGNDFTFEVTEPGNYQVVVRGFDDKGQELYAVTTLTADYKATLPADCPLVTALSMLRCATVEVPVRAGIQELRITATRSPLLVEPGFGTLYLAASDGTQQTARMVGNEATITLDGFDHDTLGADWELYYSPDVGAAEDVEYTISLLHSSPGSGTTFQGSLSALWDAAKAQELPATVWSDPTALSQATVL